MNKKTKSYLKRAIGYIVGLVLLYAPFGVYERIMVKIFGERGNADIHKVCFTMSISRLLSGQFALFTIGTALVSFIILIVVTVFFGPLYCGKLCPVGALPEYLSLLVPKKIQLKLKDQVKAGPIRFGFLAAFAIAPFIGAALTCTFCAFSFMQRLMNVPKSGIGMLLSSSILTMIMWLIVGGIFNLGGRGWCNYMSPVGAFQGLIHVICSRLPFTFKLKMDRNKCVTCGACTSICAMGALQIEEGKVVHTVSNCMECGACRDICPTKALTYGAGTDGWKINVANEQAKAEG